MHRWCKTLGASVYIVISDEMICVVKIMGMVAYAADYRPVRIIDLIPTRYRQPLSARNVGTENGLRADCH